MSDAASPSAAFETLTVPVEQALLEGQIDGLVAITCQNERPLAGLAGLVDWRFHGSISRSLKTGAITGQPGECVYFPVERHGRVFHLILAGGGYAETPGARGRIPPETLRSLRKNLATLGVSRIGASRADLGGAADGFLEKHLKGAPLWLAP